MYIILNRAGLVVAVTRAVSYIKVTDAGLPIITTREEATAIYAADNDTIYTLRSASVWGGGGWEVREVETVPDEVVPGFWYWSEVDGFYTTTEQEAALAVEELKKTAPAAASIAFVTLAEAGQIDAATATENAQHFASWAENVNYPEGAIRRDPEDGGLYQAITAHTSAPGWEPHNTPALWKHIGDPAEEWPEWSAPVGAHDAYAKDSKTSHNGKKWVSEVDGNVWEPGVYGWIEAATIEKEEVE